MNTQTKSVAQMALELGLTAEEVVGQLNAIGVRGAAPSTALADADIRDLTARVKPWGPILAHATNDGPATPPLRIEKRDGGAITLDRAWDAQEQGLVWTKTHKPTTGKRAEDRLSFLCEWENTLLKRATLVGVKRCAHVIEDHFKNSPVHMGDTPMDQREHRTSRVRTMDAGPTLDIWRLMRPRVDGYAQAHPFVEQRNYLQLVRGILLALEEFHDHGFVHLDLHPGNIALPARVTTQSASPERGEHILLEPLWNDIRVIDLDFSACSRISPLARLPHELKDGVPAAPMSDHLRLRLLAFDSWLKDHNLQDRCWDQAFFAKKPQADLLDCFRSLDWREDLYQLGYWLAYIRDHWGGAAHVITTGPQRDVNRFINTFAEDLMKWGGDEQIRWDSIRRSNAVPTPELPHRDYIGQIDDLLLKWREVPKHTVLHRADHDLGYEKRRASEVAAHEERQRHLLEQERRDQNVRKLEEKLESERTDLAKKRLLEEQQAREQETARQTDQLALDQRDQIAREEAEEGEAARRHHEIELVAQEAAKREQQVREAQERDIRERKTQDEARRLAEEAAHPQAAVERERLPHEQEQRLQAPGVAASAVQAPPKPTASGALPSSINSTVPAVAARAAATLPQLPSRRRQILEIWAYAAIVAALTIGAYQKVKGRAEPADDRPRTSQSTEDDGARAKAADVTAPAKALTKAPALAASGDSFRTMEPILQVAGCKECGQMAVIPAGTFTMGSNDHDDEKPPHPVSIRQFEMGRTEVTQGQWKAVMGSGGNPSHFKHCGETCPVERVSWDDVQDFIQKLNAKTGKRYRLPSEAEWEYAARAGSQSAHWWGDSIDTNRANYDGDDSYKGGPKGENRKTTLPANSFNASPFGLYNVHGNVYEWVEDCWHENYNANSAPKDQSAWVARCTRNYRVVRGGNWRDSPAALRSATRISSARVNRNFDIGFRLARTLSPPTMPSASLAGVVGATSQSLAAPNVGTARPANADQERAPGQQTCQLLSDGTVRLKTAPTVVLFRDYVIATSVADYKAPQARVVPRGTSERCNEWRTRVSIELVDSTSPQQEPDRIVDTARARPRDVPPPYSDPYIRNPETGEYVKTIPLGRQPKLKQQSPVQASGRVPIPYGELTIEGAESNREVNAMSHEVQPPVACAVMAGGKEFCLPLTKPPKVVGCLSPTGAACTK